MVKSIGTRTTTASKRSASVIFLMSLAGCGKAFLRQKWGGHGLSAAVFG
jgi:hypothetical protein